MKRKGVKIQLTTDQIAKMWPILEQLAAHNRQTSKANHVAILGQVEVKDTGRVTATAKWTLLTPDEASTVQALLGGTGTTSDAAKKQPAKKTCGTMIYLGMGEEFRCGKPAAFLFDEGLTGECPICYECSDDYDPNRLTKIPA